MPVPTLRISPIPYSQDSASLFNEITDLPWAVFLDSGPPRGAQGRYDILAAQPYISITTRGNMSEIRSSTGVEISRDDPFALIRQQLGEVLTQDSDLPFCGGAIGYFGYDLARRLEALPAISEDAENLPEMAVGIYDWAVVVDHKRQQSCLVSAGRDPATAELWEALLSRLKSKCNRFRTPFEVTSRIASNLSSTQYAQAFSKAHEYINNGDCYQVNLAQRFSASAKGDAWLAYQSLRVINPAPFSAYLNFPFAQVLSTSPERFLQVRERAVETRPIKGTRRRSGHPGEDAALAAELEASAKDRAENLMIVDLLRNDLGKTCVPGSVTVSKLFNIESYATVHHLVSTVNGKLRDGEDALSLLRGCFPGGSITGAPKLRAMEIIEELEPHRRGIYCGAIGYIGFDGAMDTNIVIRTLVNSAGKIRFWAGGGIVADSVMQEEYQETLDKAAALLRLLEQSAISQLGS